MHNVTLTYFCHHKGAGIWYPTVIPGTDVHSGLSYMVRSYGAEFSDDVAIHIPYRTSTTGARIVANKQVLSRKEWDALTTGQNGYLTIKGGGDADAIWLGDYSTVDPLLTPISDSDYASGFFDWLKKTKDGVFAVSKVSDYSLIPHYEILAK